MKTDQLPNYFCSYREGLDVIDYFNSTYGSRKGLVDTAMKTAASGYLTRKLVDVAQDVRVTAEDCGTLNSIQKFPTEGGDLGFKINGRVAGEDIVHPETGDVLVPANAVISAEMADLIDKLGVGGGQSSLCLDVRKPRKVSAPSATATISRPIVSSMWVKPSVSSLHNLSVNRERS